MNIEEYRKVISKIVKPKNVMGKKKSNWKLKNKGIF